MGSLLFSSEQSWRTSAHLRPFARPLDRQNGNAVNQLLLWVQWQRDCSESFAGSHSNGLGGKS
jgi:hypothetical protein